MVKARGWITAKTNEFKQNCNIKRNEQKINYGLCLKGFMHISVKLGGSCAEKILKVYCSKLPVANTRPTCGYFLLYDKLFFFFWKRSRTAIKS